MVKHNQMKLVQLKMGMDNKIKLKMETKMKKKEKFFHKSKENN